MLHFARGRGVSRFFPKMHHLYGLLLGSLQCAPERHSWTLLTTHSGSKDPIWSKLSDLSVNLEGKFSMNFNNFKFYIFFTFVCKICSCIMFLATLCPIMRPNVPNLAPFGVPPGAGDPPPSKIPLGASYGTRLVQDKF